MFRLSRPWNNRRDKYTVDGYEQSRPRFINGSTERTSTPPESAPFPNAATRPANPSANSEDPIRNTHKERAFDAWVLPRLIKAPWDIERTKAISSSRRTRSVYRFPAHVFKNLPKEVYECIIAQLEQIYRDSDQACSSCYLRDLHNLSLTSRAWNKTASTTMYHKVLVLANEEHGGLQKLKIKGTSRLKLLRRTLRENLELARRVKELHMSDFQLLYQNATIEREEIANLVASLVMACPRLERLVGFHLHSSQAFDRLSHALSTRSELKERVWMLADTDGDAGVDDDEERLSEHYYIAECDPTERFLELNSNHPALSTLVLYEDRSQSSTNLNFRAIVGTFRNCPHMRHLAISGLAANSFSNMALNAIPATLLSLRLENLPGVSEKGIQRLATSQQAISIQTLALIDLDIGSILTIADILSTHLASLRKFSLVQTRAPTLSNRTLEVGFASPSLEYIHWELRSEASPLPPFISPLSVDVPELQPYPFTSLEPISCQATSLLAAGIQAGAFPSLRRIRIPHDPQGVIQLLCKPLATALLPSDTAKFANAPRVTTSDGFSILLDEPARSPSKAHKLSTRRATSTSRVDSVVSSSTLGSSPVDATLTPMRSRLAAQSRILAARKNAAMIVRVFDPEGEIRVNNFIGGHIGRIDSQVTYELSADVGTAGQTEWIPGIDDLVGVPCDVNTDVSERARGSCGHVLSGGIGRNIVRVENLF